MPADVVDLEAIRRDRRLAEALAVINERLAAAPLPTPEELGWAVLERDEAGRPLRVFCARYAALAGYVAGRPDLVWLDFHHVHRAYATTLEALLVGLETGILPDPVATVGCFGRRPD